MKRGDIYDGRLHPSEGSEQSGIRPLLIVSRNTINQASPVIVIVPLTSAKNVKRQYPNDVLINATEGGLSVDSVALTGQVRAISKRRLLNFRGSIKVETMQQIDRALKITLDLP